MNNKLIHKALTAIVAILAITACGGGSKEPMPEPTPTPPSPVVEELQFGFSANVSSAQEATVGALTKAGKDENIALRLYVSEAGFSTDTASNTVMTKGAVIDQSGFLSTYQSSGIGMFGYKPDSQILGSASSGSKVTYASTTGRWSVAEKITWNVGEKMNFFAYAPYVTNSDGPIVSASSNAGSPTISYSTPSDVAKQTDVLVAKSIDFARPSTNNFVVPLTFKHALSTIEFKISKDFPAVTINSITLKGVKGKGKYSLKDEAWSEAEGNNGYSLTINKSFTSAQTQANAKVNGDNEVMFLLPQAFADEASTIEVTYALASNPNTPLTFTAPIKTSTDKWEQGKKYTYILVPAKAPDPVVTTERTSTFEVADIPSFTYEGGTNTITVKSETEIKTLIDGVVTGDPQIIRQPWNVEYSTDEGVTYSKTAPEWLTITRDEATNNAIVTVQPQTPTETTTTSNGNVEWASEKGTANFPYNLSNATGSATVENTANCYIVNGPGWYKLPLVYGNGIKNGKENPVAYTSTTGTFVNHLSNVISAPYIYSNSGCAPSSASIVWQDADKEVVTKAELCDNNTFLKFYIAPETLNYDNAIVAVKDASGTIMWSWHIWVTDYKSSVKDVAYTSPNDNYGGDGRTRTFISQPIGYIPATSATATTELSYAARSCKVKFIMECTENQKVKTVVKDIVQTSYSAPPASVQNSLPQRCLYYQWGRKDPQRVGGQSNNDTFFNYAISIQHPDIMSGYDYSPSQTVFYDAWNSGLMDSSDRMLSVVKTIYDPAPVGYCVPNSYALVGPSDDFIPLLGYLSSEVNKMGTEAYYWSACTKPGQAYFFHVYSPAKGLLRRVMFGGFGATIVASQEEGDNTTDTTVDVNNYDGDDPYVLVFQHN